MLPPKSRVLLQLSGGKDSVACLLLLLKYNLHVEAIHFTHKYAYDLPSSMARSVCRQFDVTLHCRDISQELESKFLDDFRGRPCRKCKAIMDGYTVKFAAENAFHYICVGDNAEDTMLINRLKEEDGAVACLSRYFNKEVELPSGLQVYRPLLFMHSDQILTFVQDNIPHFRRINDTGDKYFEYSREGCPLQFKDLGAKYSSELMCRLKQYNVWCSEFATSMGIKASIHLPSGFIVTIPKGFEDQCRTYLIKKGAMLKDVVKCDSITAWSIYLRPRIFIEDDSVKEEVLKRFSERLGYEVDQVAIDGNHWSAETAFSYVSMTWNRNRAVLIINVLGNMELAKTSLGNLCIEVFHTNDYQVSSSIL